MQLDPGAPENLQAILKRLGRDAVQCVARANDTDILSLYKQRTDEARDLGIFGSPSFVVGAEVFWGDDRLDDAIAWCQAH
jgi:2-hydroxychromene-2-carboxylate isomerase